MNRIIIFPILISLDLITKSIVKNNLILNQKVKLNQFLDFIYIQNFGVSFGLFSNYVSHWVLIIVAILIVLLIIYLMISSTKKLEKFAYFIIIIGAIANILDRMINTFVVDFILIHYNDIYWPAFNLADIYITIGIIMIIISFFIKSEVNK